MKVKTGAVDSALKEKYVLVSWYKKCPDIGGLKVI